MLLSNESLAWFCVVAQGYCRSDSGKFFLDNTNNIL